MKYFNKEYTLEVWGEYACFTRPELKVERVSYDVITPSAARAIFDAIFWKPAFKWEIIQIEVLNPIQWFSIRRNEVGCIASEKKSQIFIEENRQIRNSLMLKDVRYRIHALQVFIPIDARSQGTVIRQPDKNESPAKYNAIFERRAEKGQCFNQPYLGTRECMANFKLVANDCNQPLPIRESKDLGIMFYDWDYKPDGKNAEQMFFKASMKEGVINVPPKNSNEILR